MADDPYLERGRPPIQWREAGVGPGQILDIAQEQYREGLNFGLRTTFFEPKTMPSGEVANILSFRIGFYQNRRLGSERGKVSPKKEGERRLRGARWKPRVLAFPTETSHPLHG